MCPYCVPCWACLCIFTLKVSEIDYFGNIWYYLHGDCSFPQHISDGSEVGPSGLESTMNIYAAASLFSLLILIYFIISEVFTIIFHFVGLPEEKARFQVTSLLTGCGFTTHESEMILSTKRRRRLARITMLFGYVFNISVVSAFINVFLSLKTTEVGNYVAGIIIPIAVVALLIGLTRIRAVRRWIDRVIEKVVGTMIRSDTSNSIIVIDQIGKGTIAQVTIRSLPDEFEGVELSNTRLKEDKNILIMLVEHKDLKIEAPTAHTVFVNGDTLTVYGDYKTVCKVFMAKERFA